MNILSIDTSSQAASAAIATDGKLLGEYYVSVKKTHSQTIMPMVQSLLQSCDMRVTDIDVFAVTVGPGSFTGLRIGIAAVKGMAFACDTLCVPVSTLEALAEAAVGFEGTICAVMDARCNQVYTAIFNCTNGVLTRLCDDAAIALEELRARLLPYKNIILVGDGAGLCTQFTGCRLATEQILLQHAASVCAVAQRVILTGGGVSPDNLLPTYLRLPQAERELKLKKKGAELT